MPVFVYFKPIQDAYVSEFYPDQNFGQVPYLFCNRYQGSYDEYQSLVQFDLCSLGCNGVPVNSTVDPNFLYLNIYRNEIPSSTRLYAYRIKQWWDENTVTWNTRPLVDYSYPVGYVDIPSGYFGPVQMTLDPAIVMKWYNGYYQNYGLLLKCEVPENSLIGFFAREYNDADFWPTLAVCYTQHCCEDNVT